MEIQAWYKAFPRDISDANTYRKLEMPVRGLGAEYVGHVALQTVKSKATDFQLVKVENGGHFIQIEQPQFVTDKLPDFFLNSVVGDAVGKDHDATNSASGG